ncbi:dihydropteroate synthase [Saliphagus infecundisoli]|uniref:dihydropteroate synthase n=1 Tax=Saliphagus infecundisoli TaxID=1849069 RepID=A0ABD5QHX4_9EURY|nr:dihydropteroate synthase [Saliphagus infecundisoli]
MESVEAAGVGIGDDHPPRIMGVLNVSEESPYDPSVHDDPDEAAAYVDEELIGEGADIVDVGLESANKRFEVLSEDEELDRLDVACETVEAVSGEAVFSIETRYGAVADEALSRGFDMVNDVCGFTDPEMPDVCRDHDAAVVKMASPDDLRRPGAVEEIDWAARKSPEWADSADYADMIYEALKRNGLTEKTIVDPAFGGWSEAKTLADDRATFRRLAEFRALGRPLLVSINRKNFLGEIAGRETDERLPVSLAATALAVERGAHVLRTHDVAETRDAAAIGREFADRRSSEDGGVSVTSMEPSEFEALVADHADGAIADASPRLVRIDGLDSAQRGAVERAAWETEATAVSLGGTVALAGRRSDLRSIGSRLDGVGEALRDVLE